jgi:hypothetical protein
MIALRRVGQSLEALAFFDKSCIEQEGGFMAKMKTQAWQIVDSLDRLRSDFIANFIRNGEPARVEDAKETLAEFTTDLKKLVARCERIADDLTTKRSRGKSEPKA